MFGIQFYPSTPELIDDLVSPYVRSVTWRSEKEPTLSLPFDAILDPSAGKGDILLRLHEKYNVSISQLNAIEIDRSLQMILTTLGFRVVDSDYLGARVVEHYDFIIANPPFRNGSSHLVKMWKDMTQGDIACVLNAQTILNPNSDDDRTVCELVKLFGRSEVRDGVFEDAERSSNVKVVLIWLKKVAAEKVWNFEPREGEKEYKAGVFSPNWLASSDLYASLVDSYNCALDALIEIDTQTKKFAFHTAFLKKTDEGRDKRSLNEKVLLLKKDFWGQVFDRTKLGEVTTSNFVAKFRVQQSHISSLAFTLKDIQFVLDTFMFNRSAIMDECILSVFDRAVGADAENRVIWTWKTNSGHRLNEKVILPWIVGCPYGRWEIRYDSVPFVNDIDKVMCYLSGKDYADVDTIAKAFNRRSNLLSDRKVTMDPSNPEKKLHYSNTFTSEFFTIKFFQKGTMHLKFRSKLLCEDFNVRAATGKGWLGNG